MEGGLARMAGDRKSATMRLRNVISDAEAETGTGNLILHRRPPVESLEDAILFLGGNTFPVVGTLEMDRTTAIVDADGHGAARGRILQSIVEDLFQSEFPQPPVHGYWGKLAIANHFHWPVLDFRAQGSDEIPNQVLCVGHFPVKLDLLRRQTRHLERVID